MKNFISLFFIVFAGIAISWFGLLVVGANSLSPSEEFETTMVVAGDDVIITGHEGLAARGEQVYRALACAACHTQQVRRPGYGGDFERAWGSRQSVARDYMLQDTVVLGTKRLGPDLTNVGARHDAEWFFKHLYNPGSLSEVSNVPSYSFLFTEREMSDGNSSNSLKLEGNDIPEEGFEVVPTDDAVALVAYLQSLNLDYDLPESKRIK